MDLMEDALLFQNNPKYWDQRDQLTGPCIDFWPWTAKAFEVRDLLGAGRPVVFYDTRRKVAWDLGWATGWVDPAVDFTHWRKIGGIMPGAEVLRLGFTDLDVELPVDYAWWRVRGDEGRHMARTFYFMPTNDIIPSRFARPLIRSLKLEAQRRNDAMGNAA